MTDLMAFLRARLDERAADATRIHRDDCDSAIAPDFPGPCDCGEPAWVLREVEAKRRQLDLVNSPGPMELRLLAFSYSDHPDYDETWRP